MSRTAGAGEEIQHEMMLVRFRCERQHPLDKGDRLFPIRKRHISLLGNIVPVKIVPEGANFFSEDNPVVFFSSYIPQPSQLVFLFPLVKHRCRFPFVSSTPRNVLNTE